MCIRYRISLVRQLQFIYTRFLLFLSSFSFMSSIIYELEFINTTPPIRFGNTQYIHGAPPGFTQEG